MFFQLHVFKTVFNVLPFSAFLESVRLIPMSLIQKAPYNLVYFFAEECFGLFPLWFKLTCTRTINLSLNVTYKNEY